MPGGNGFFLGGAILLESLSLHGRQQRFMRTMIAGGVVFRTGLNAFLLFRFWIFPFYTVALLNNAGYMHGDLSIK